MKSIILIDLDKNNILTDIVNKLEEEIKCLMLEVTMYDAVQHKLFKNYQELQTEYMVKCQDYESHDDRYIECIREIKILARLAIDIRNQNGQNFNKIHEIEKKQKIIQTIKEMSNCEYIDEIIEFIKNK